MRPLHISLAAALAWATVACSPSPFIHDPGCQAAYEHCARGCEMGPPVPTFGQEGMPSFEAACANGCYTDARACERRASARHDEPGKP